MVCGKKADDSAPPPKRAKASKGEGLDPKEATKMRNWLTYNASSADEDVQKKALQAQEVWKTCKNPNERRMFLESFQKDKSKNLDWVHSFQEECENAEKHKEWAKKGYVTVSQALKEQNLSLSDFDNHKKALEFVQEWWEDNSETYKTKEAFPVKYDKKDRILWHEFYFIFPQMAEDSLETSDTKKFVGEGSVKSAKALEWAASRMGELGNVSSSSGPQVKLENPLWPTILENKDAIAPSPRQFLLLLLFLLVPLLVVVLNFLLLHLGLPCPSTRVR